MPKDKQILLKIKEYFVNIMCKLNPDYSINVTNENKR